MNRFFNRKNILFLLSLLIVFCFSVSILLFSKNVSATANYSNMYSDRSSVSVNYFDKDGKTGIRFLPYKKNAKVNLIKDYVGNFSLEFDTDEKVGEFELAFTSNVINFSIVFNAKKGGNNTSIKISDNLYGIYYYNNSCLGLTEKSNKEGKFTQTSFGSINKIFFDADNMKILVGDNTGEFVVWDLSSKINDGVRTDFSFDSIGYYSVDLLFKNKDFTLNCYKINEIDQEKIIIDFSGPSIFVEPTKKMKLGERFYFPKAYCSDFFDGKIEDVNLEILFKNSTVYSDNYEYGDSFVPNNLGNYKFIFSASDKNGNISQKEIVIECLNEAEILNWDLEYHLSNDIYGVGSSVLLPNCYLESNYLSKGKKCNAVIKFDGSIINRIVSFDGVNNNIRLDRCGLYEISYEVDGFNFNESKTFSMEVLNDIPSVSSFKYYNASLNDEFVFYDVTSYLNGNQVNVIKELVFPSGKVSETSCVLNETGEYNVIYYADNTQYKANFEVKKPLFSSQGSSSVSYSTSPYEDVSGLNVLLQSNDTLYLNQAIDISNCTKEDDLIEFYMTPSQKGENEITQLQVYLIDKYDADNYITIDISQVFDNYVTYIKSAASNGQVLSGWENYGANNAHFWSNGSVWGTWCAGNLSASTYLGQPMEYTFKFSFDYQTKCLYAQIVPGVKNLVVDFDDDSSFSQVWEGFTTGEIVIGIKGFNFTSSSATLFIKNIYDVDLALENEVDNLGPIINIDNEGYDLNSLPDGKCGVPYRVLTATATDSVSGVKSIDVSVKSQDTSDEYEIINGCFTPDKCGNYIITYKAVDYFNNRTDMTLVVAVKDVLDPITVLAEPKEFVVVGEKYYIESAEYFGGSGNLSCGLQVNFDGVWTNIYDGYIFTKSGIYSSRYHVNDYLGNSCDYDFTITATYSEIPVFSNFVEYPNYFVAGAKYDLLNVGAKYFSDKLNGEECEIKCYLIDNNGENEILDTYFVPEVSKNGDITTIKYVAQYQDKSNTLLYEIPTIKLKYSSGYSINNYFQSNDLDIVYKEGDGIVLEGSKNSSAEWIKNLVADGFELSFDVDRKKNNVGKIIITLYDSEIVNEKIKFTIYNTKSSTSKMSINDGKLYEIQGSFVSESKYKFKINYDNIFKTVVDELKYKQVISTTMFDEVFDGFSSGKVRFNIEFEDVVGDFCIYVKSVGNQNFSSLKTNRVQPMASLSNSYPKIVDKNEEINLYDCIAEDVLDPSTTILFSVFCNGNYVYSKDGTLLKNLSLENGKNPYSMVFSEFGTYSIEYTIRDESGNKNSLSLQVLVLSDINPIITIDGKVKTNASKNSSYVLPNASAVDYEGEFVRIIVVITDPTGKRSGVEPKDNITFSIKGSYVIRYFAVDSLGNFAERSFVVAVS